MPQYEAELSDGRVVTVESDNPPTEDQILSAIGGQQRPASAALIGPQPPRFQPTRELAPPPQGEEQIIQSQRNPLTALTTVGRTATGGLADIGNILTGQPYEGNIEAGLRGEEMPAEEVLKNAPLPIRVPGRAAQGLIETTPKLAAVVGLESVGIPAPVAAGTIFGVNQKGEFSPQDAAVAAALPFAGKYSGEIVGAIAKKLGVTAADALRIYKAAGGTAGASAYLATIQESEIQNLPPEQRKDARIEAIAQNIGQAGLGALGLAEEKPQLIEKGQDNAETIRGNQGQLLAPGQEPKGGREIGGNDVQQPPSGSPNAPGPSEAPSNVSNEAGVTATPTAGELISMSPADYNTWKKEIKYGPDDAAKIASNLSNADIERLAAERDRVREEVSKLTDPEEIMRVSLKSQTLNEIVHAKSESETTPPPPPPPPTATATQSTGRGLAGNVRVKWATATEPFGSEAGFINLEPLKDLGISLGRGVKASIDAVRAAGKEAFDPRKMNDYRRGVLNWSARLQKSFGEASDAQKEIMSKVPDPVRREGITNWLQADGDAATLRARASATTDPKLKKGYEAALNLTPEEIAVARDVRQAFDALLNRGMSYDVIKSFKDNYVTQIWDLGNKFFGNATRTLKDKFRFARASTFANYFEGEQNGFKPKTKDIAKILPLYLHEMNSVIAARQLVQELSKGVASDGRPLVIPRGGASQIDTGGGDKATLVMPKAIGRMGQAPFDVRDYKVLPNQPAFNDWRWVSKDDAGNPVFLKSDLALHPEAYNRLKDVLGKSAISEWYRTKTSALMEIPKGIARLLDMGQAETKKMMFGLIAPFHQVQEGTHAVGHRVSPFNDIPKIDLANNPEQMDAARHSLMMLPDRASADNFMEGFRASGLISRIPGIGPLADRYSNYLFHQYIPGLKFKTYQAILERNIKVFSDDLSSGKVKPEDVKVLSAEQTNAAYGHLNYADLGRNPTIQHLLRWALLAPDFFEARSRFALQASKGLTGAGVGREQLAAVATLAIGQMIASYTAAKLSGGDWDAKRPFEFRKGNRSFYLRSVPEDIFRFVTDTRQFAYNRLNPIIGKGLVQLFSGTDWRGQKVTPGETLKELAQQPVPLTLRGILGLGHTPLAWWEQTLGALGLKISRYSAGNDIYKMVQEFKKNSNNPKLVAEYERDRKTVNPDSDYKPLRDALIKNDLTGASKEYEKLLQTKKPSLVVETMRPYTDVRIPGTDVTERHFKPFTGSRKFEPQFKASLNEDEKALYQKAIDERMDTFKKFRELIRQRNAAKQ